MTCPVCRGSGETGHSIFLRTCSNCLGGGQVLDLSPKGEHVVRTALMLDAREDCASCGKKDQMFRLRDGLPRCSNCDALHPNAGADAIAKFEVHASTCPRCAAVSDGAPGPLCAAGEEIRKASTTTSSLPASAARVVPFPGGAR